MATATIPQVNYVTDNSGKPLFVQLSIQDWTSFIEEYQRLVTLLQFKSQLKNAFREIRQIQKGEKSATTLSEFLHEL
ncbi:MAG: hypothetical protein KA138_06835 [Saprospiraceae bacterium]|jgi:hypothetical protein|nr:hypothetical protein [Lewinellaceae bacterium]MBP6811215.1 hypothetical protein [Saprospiraceae bacterium]